MKVRYKGFFKLINNSKGFTITEAVVAAGIMSVGFLGYMTYSKMLANAEKEVSDSISATRVLNTVINDLKSDNRYILPLDMEPDDAIFEDSALSAERCYDRLGGKSFFPKDGFASKTEKEKFIEEKCFYYTQFYKTKVNHQNVAVKSRIPLSQFHIRVRYFQGTKNNRRAIYTTMTPFIANTAHF